MNPFDRDDVRSWFQAHMDQVVPLEGQPTPGIHLLFDAHREVIELPEILQADPEFDLAATYQAQARRADVRCAVMVALLQRQDGAHAALVLSVDHTPGGPAGWWACWRGFEMTSAGLGAFASGWEEAVGDGSPPEPFSSLVIAGPCSHPRDVAPGAMPEPDLRTLFVELPHDAPLPATAIEMTEFTAANTMPTVLAEGLDHARVIRLRGRDCEIWEVRGNHLPSTIDDHVRYICRFGDPAEAVALAAITRIDERGEAVKAVRIVAELGTERAELVITLRWPSGAKLPVACNTYTRKLPHQEGAGWLGVDPQVPWELYAKAPFE
jgi:hypothetical protein